MCYHEDADINYIPSSIISALSNTVQNVKSQKHNICEEPFNHVKTSKHRWWMGLALLPR